MKSKPEVGKYYEIIKNRIGKDKWTYHGFKIGQIVKCGHAGAKTSSFSSLHTNGKLLTQNVRNKHVRPADKNFTSIWEQ